MNSPQNTFAVKPLSKPIRCQVEVPGSKSITNRALLLAGMANGTSRLTNVLFSDDARKCMGCMESLGYDITISEPERTVVLTGGAPQSNSRINVGSAGTAARFITAMLAANPGVYEIQASEQMKARPMKPLLDALAGLGAQVTALEKEGHLPVRLQGGRLAGGRVWVEASRSSQFLSALLMTGPLYAQGLIIEPIGTEIAKSYIDITLTMMAQFGGSAEKCLQGENRGCYIVPPAPTPLPYQARPYQIEPDVSGACYFFALAAMTGSTVRVKDVKLSSMQGDIQFLDALQRLGCQVAETEEGVTVTGPEGGRYPGIDVDMNDYSDQTMTMAALAVFASSPTTIRNVGHIKYQETNRIAAVLAELRRMRIDCAETDDGLVIRPGTPRPTVVETYDDHRMAMAFSLIGLRAPGIQIANPGCTAKTFENYFDLLARIQDGAFDAL